MASKAKTGSHPDEIDVSMVDTVESDESLTDEMEGTLAELERKRAEADSKEELGASITGFSDDNRGMIEKGVNMVVGILVVGLLTAYLLPIALNELNAVDTTSWGSAEAALFGLLGIFFVLGIVLFVVNAAMDAKS